VFNVTALVAQGPEQDQVDPARSRPKASTLVVGLQTYMSSNYDEGSAIQPKVLMQLDLVLRNGTRMSFGSGATFAAYNATDYFNPTCCASAYSSDEYQPHDNFDARKEPVGWSDPGYNETERWSPAVTTAGFVAPLRPRPSSQLLVTHGMRP